MKINYKPAIWLTAITSAVTYMVIGDNRMVSYILGVYFMISAYYDGETDPTGPQK